MNKYEAYVITIPFLFAYFVIFIDVNTISLLFIWFVNNVNWTFSYFYFIIKATNWKVRAQSQLQFPKFFFRKKLKEGSNRAKDGEKNLKWFNVLTHVTSFDQIEWIISQRNYFFKKWDNPGIFLFIFVFFSIQFQ